MLCKCITHYFVIITQTWHPEFGIELRNCHGQGRTGRAGLEPEVQAAEPARRVGGLPTRSCHWAGPQPHGTRAAVAKAKRATWQSTVAARRLGRGTPPDPLTAPPPALLAGKALSAQPASARPFLGYEFRTAHCSCSGPGGSSTKSWPQRPAHGLSAT